MRLAVRANTVPYAAFFVEYTHIPPFVNELHRLAYFSKQLVLCRQKHKRYLDTLFTTPVFLGLLDNNGGAFNVVPAGAICCVAAVEAGMVLPGGAAGRTDTGDPAIRADN